MAKRGDTRVIALVVGAPDSKTRFKEVSEMFNYAFANYENKVYVNKNGEVGSIAISGGKESAVNVISADKLTAFGKKGEADYNVEYEIETSVKAPVKRGDVVGKAKLLDANGNVVKETALTVQKDIEAKSYWDYVKDIATNN